LIPSRWAALAAALGLLLVAGCGGSSRNPFNDTPAIIALFPSSATAGGQPFTLSIAGTGFFAGSVAYWNNSPRTTTFDPASSQLSVSITAQDIAAAGTAQVVVVNPTPGGGASTAVSFAIAPPSNPIPAISSLSPSSTPVGTLPPGGTVTVNGSNFIPTSTVALNGVARTPTFVSPSELTVALTSSDVASNTTLQVTAVNPAPGGGVSNAVPFTVGTGSAAVSRRPSVGSVSQSPVVVSVSASGGPADGQSSAPAISAGGRFVAFYSTATNLISEGASGNIFVRDNCLGTANCTPRTIAVDLGPDGGAPDGPSDAHLALSADGRFIAFASVATNLVSVSPDGQPSQQLNLYIRDLCLGSDAPVDCSAHTEIVSLGTDLQPANDSSVTPSLSTDGRFVTFTSTATNLVSGVSNGQAEVYVRDTCAGPTAPAGCVPRTIAVSADTQDGTSAQAEGSPAISANGRYVAFTVESPATGGTPSASQVFLRDTCLGAAAPSACVPSTMRISLATDGSGLAGSNSDPSLSADGRFVVFESQAPGGPFGIFLRDTCLGPAASADCVPSTAELSEGAAAPSISPSGRYISFIAPAAGAVANGSPASGSLYVYDTCFGATGACTAQEYAVAASPADSQAGPLPVDASTPAPLSSDGGFVAFFTSAALPNLPLSGHGDVFLATTPF
jgi:Tol biopolymer transport system component